MKKKKLEYQNIYNKNPETGNYMIEVSLEDYSELFNGWDASPLRRKDLEPELVDYLEQVGSEIPSKEKIELCFYLPKEINDTEKEQKSMIAIKNNFKIAIFFINRKLSKGYRKMFIYVILSLIFITLAYMLRITEELPLLSSILREGLFIGGWVFLWEAFSLMTFTTHEERVRRNIFYRFIDCDIYFKDIKND
jgi:hypothetical protein